MERPRDLITKLDVFFGKHFPSINYTVSYAKRLGMMEGAKVQVKFANQPTVEELLAIPNPRGGR
jgi:hypothetical protein